MEVSNSGYQDVEYGHELLHEVYHMLHHVLEEGDRERITLIMAQLVGISHSLLEALNLLDEEIRLASVEHF